MDIVVVQTSSGVLIVPFLPGAVMVVDKTGVTELLVQFSRLSAIRIDPKLESLFDYLDILLIFDVLFDDIQRDSANSRDELATRPQVRQTAFQRWVFFPQSVGGIALVLPTMSLMPIRGSTSRIKCT